MSIIIKPIVTEKVTKDSEVSNRFGFVVRKKQIKFRSEMLLKLTFGVSVVSVNTMNVRCWIELLNTLKVV